MIISIFKFLSRYYGITLNAGLQCSHKDLKYNFSFLKRCSFEYADSNPDLIGNGEIIYVVDSYNNIVPYFCPDEYINASEDCSYTVYDDLEDYEFKVLSERISEIPTYLLKELFHKYRNKCNIYRLIKNELILRGVYQNKKHKINKEIKKMEIEESGFNDKYKRRRKIKYNKS